MENTDAARHRLGLAPVGAEAAGEHDKNQSRRANLFSQLVVVKRNPQQAVDAAYHPQNDEHQQHGDTEPKRQTVEQDT